MLAESQRRAIGARCWLPSGVKARGDKKKRRRKDDESAEGKVEHRRFSKQFYVC